MKKFIMFVLVAFASLVTMNAETKVAEYHSSLYNKNFDIKADLNKSKTAISNIFIYVGGETETERVALEFSGSNINELICSLNDIKLKYVEWSKMANDNNIANMSKVIPITLPTMTVWWFGSKWWFAKYQKCQFRFVVIDNKPSIALSKKVCATSNEYIDTRFYLVFCSVDELDEFIKILDVDKFKNVLINESNTNDLFQ